MYSYITSIWQRSAELYVDMLLLIGTYAQDVYKDTSYKLKGWDKSA